MKDKCFSLSRCVNLLVFNVWVNFLFCFSPVTLFELTVVNNWYITMVRLNHLSVVFSISHHFADMSLISGCHCLTAAFSLPQEGVTSMTSHWSRLYFMTFYIVTMVRARDCTVWVMFAEVCL